MFSEIVVHFSCCCSQHNVRENIPFSVFGGVVFPYRLLVALDLPLALLEIPLHALPGVRDSVCVLHALAPHDVQRGGRDEVLVGAYQAFPPREVEPARILVGCTLKSV